MKQLELPPTALYNMRASCHSLRERFLKGNLCQRADHLAVTHDSWLDHADLT